MKAKDKPVSFRLYPEGTFLYAEVNIWPTKKAMHAYNPLPGNYEAACGGRECFVVPPKGKGRTRKTGLFAEVNFCKGKLGIEIVSHELTHAAFAFAERRKLALGDAIGDHNWKVGGDKEILDQDGVEERFCYALGKMCRQFSQKCYDLGIYQAVVEPQT